MNNLPEVFFVFLGGTIMSVNGGYKVLPQPPSERTFQRLSDAKWFLALCWCEQITTPAGILTNAKQLSFYNGSALKLGEEGFIPPKYRPIIFEQCLHLKPLETSIYRIPIEGYSNFRSIEIQGIEIDPRYGKVALVRDISNNYASCLSHSESKISQDSTESIELLSHHSLNY